MLRIPQLRGPERPSGRMFPAPGCRRGFPREPAPWWDGPWPRPPAGPEDTWDEPPWDEPPWDGPPCDGPHCDGPPWDGPPCDGPPQDGPPWDGPPSDGPPWNEPPWNETPWNGPPCDGPPCDGPPWNGPRRDGPPWEHQPRRWRRRRHPPSPRAPRPFPGPADAPWKEEEEDRRWAPRDCPQPPPWDDREPIPGPEDDFGECWYQDPPPDPWPEYPEEEQPPPWPPARPPGNLGTFREHRPPWSHRPAARPRGHLRQLILVPRAWCPRPPRGHKPHSKPSCPAPSKRSQPEARKEPQPPEPPRPPAPPQGAAERLEQPQDVPVGTGGVLEPPSPARSPLESPAADPGAAEPLVELEAGQTPVGSQDHDPCAPGAEPAPPEETSRNPEIQERLEVEPCSPGVPKAGSAHGSHPQSPADPAKRELLDSSSSGEAGAELSPHSWEQLPHGAGETEAEGAQDGPLQSLQPPENLQLPPESAAEPEAQPSQASPEISPGPQPGAGETNLAVSGQQQLCSVLPTPCPAGIDPRSAAVLRRKAKIELSYQQFSLSIAVVATMLLQKEPSMEAALGLALRANLRQCRLHHLQQLEEFIDSLDSGTPGL
ncbi:basic proline-rich protein-like isoform X2 [Pyrgilauda ruficollis]|uniref:basic proline-rich protein-like isoform X2 n=1 Tax=Pyrgilauda ruficollis TaxID=221976 RepID=UPI001B87F50A|nr:basic proline-rich protein-like isoform X2 [Pyrgilauda ruficollis]